MVSAGTRRFVKRPARFRCEYCRIPGWPLTIDHIIPRSAWQASTPPEFIPDHPDNLAVACYECNILGKRARMRGVDPLSGMEVDLFHPRRQRWADHFAWSADCLIVIGKTPTGWATIHTFGLNGRTYRAQRRLLRLAMLAGGRPWP